VELEHGGARNREDDDRGGWRRAGRHGGALHGLVAAGAEEDAEAEGEVGVDAGVLHLLDGEPRRVPRAHGHVHRLGDPAVAEEALRHELDGGVPHPGERAEVAAVLDVEAVVVPQHPAVVGGAVPDEDDARVGEEAVERGGDGLGVDLGEVEDEAAVADAELQGGGRRRPLAVAAATDGGPLDAEADDEAAGAEEGVVEPAGGVDPAARVARVGGGEGGDAAAGDADGVGVVVGGGAAEAGGDGGGVHGGRRRGGGVSSVGWVLEWRSEERRRDEGFGRREIGSAGQGREWGWIIHACTVLPTCPQEIMHRMLSEPFEDKNITPRI
jgi:hypothetical protein